MHGMMAHAEKITFTENYFINIQLKLCILWGHAHLHHNAALLQQLDTSVEHRLRGSDLKSAVKTCSVRICHTGCFTVRQGGVDNSKAHFLRHTDTDRLDLQQYHVCGTRKLCHHANNQANRACAANQHIIAGL